MSTISRRRDVARDDAVMVKLQERSRKATSHASMAPTLLAAELN